MGERVRRKRRGEEEGRGGHERAGRSSQEKNRGEQKNDTIIEGAIIGLKRNLALGKCPEIHKDEPN